MQIIAREVTLKKKMDSESLNSVYVWDNLMESGLLAFLGM